MIFIDSPEYLQVLGALADEVENLASRGKWSERQAFGFLFRKSTIYDPKQYIVVRDNVLRIIRGRRLRLRLRREFLLADVQEKLEQGNEILCPID